MGVALDIALVTVLGVTVLEELALEVAETLRGSAETLHTRTPHDGSFLLGSALRRDGATHRFWQM